MTDDRAPSADPADPAGDSEASADASSSRAASRPGDVHQTTPDEPTETEGSGEVRAAVELDDASKTYRMGRPVRALAPTDLRIDRGSYTAVMGPSGSGKSTLMNLIGCLDRPTEGAIAIDGDEVTALSDDERARLRGRKIGFVFQTFNLMPRLTAVENVALPMVFQGVSRADREERARDLLASVGLGDRTDHRPNELSGGQRQRVAIARALANDPTLILADEPTGNLDTETGRQIMALFADLHERGTTVLMVTHERDIAERAERIVHLLDGRVERIEELDGVGRDGTARDGGDARARNGGADGDATPRERRQGSEVDPDAPREDD